MAQTITIAYNKSKPASHDLEITAKHGHGSVMTAWLACCMVYEYQHLTCILADQTVQIVLGFRPPAARALPSSRAKELIAAGCSQLALRK
jgi:hypothetical protein